MRRTQNRSTHPWGAWIGVAYIALGAWWFVDGATAVGACFAVLGVASIVVHRRRSAATTASEASR